jgi:MFS family permease
VLPLITTFMVVTPILLITGITVVSVAILYRIREQIIVGSGLLLIGLGFVAGVLAANRVDESLMINYGWKYQYVKLLEAGVINPLKGAISPSLVPLGSWNGAIGMMILTSVFIIIGVALLSYVGSLTMGLESWKASIVPVIVLVLGLLGVYYSEAAAKAVLYNADIPGAHSLLSTSAYLRSAAIIIGLLTTITGYFILYAETRGREYLIYTASYTLASIGFGLLLTSIFPGFEKTAILQFIDLGKPALALDIFIGGAVLIVLGVIGLLIATTIEVIGSALGGVGEIEGLEAEAPVEAAGGETAG